MLTNMQGEWISQRTIYYLKTRKIKNFNIRSQINLINNSNVKKDKNLSINNVFFLNGMI